MKCNNVYCMWNFNQNCCPESEDILLGAVPNTLDCPQYDLEEALWDIHDECVSLIKKRNLRELIAIKEFIKGQRV